MDIIYPIGKGELEGEITPERRNIWIMDLEDAPRLLSEAVEGLDDEQLDTPYREGGWTIRQLVHHLADSNARAENIWNYSWHSRHHTAQITASRERKGW